MNYTLTHIPPRENKPRNKGLTMVMDKGLSLRQAEDLIESAAEYIDIVKLGFGTSIFAPQLQEKINTYKAANIKVYFGGTLFEAFIARNQFQEYVDYLKKYEMQYVEVSNGVLPINQQDKCTYIRELAKEFTVLSEVGFKIADRHLENEEWIANIKEEQAAGSWKVITEARESGNIGIFDKSGSADEQLIHDITSAIAPENLLWEAPQKNQQVWFIKLLGAEVNLGNIAVDEVIPLETLRSGLRGDTLLDFLPK